MKSNLVVSHFRNLREHTASNGAAIDYCIDCHYEALTERLYLLGGTVDGRLVAFHVNRATLTPVLQLAGGHSSTIRCLQWDSANQRIITGAEDSFLCRWTPVAAARDNMSTCRSPSESNRRSLSSIRHRPY